jgi:RpiB/LacA/LacB family sugar-phosphate isomerase
MLIRAQEMARYVENGILDCGLTGYDWIMEQAADVKEVAELMKGEALEKKVTIEMEVPDDLPLVQANREDVTRVFTNLLDNAIKYNVTSGTVTVEHEIRGGMLLTHVSDTGIGMSIAANKVHGARAALCYDAFCAYRARWHNDANIITMGANLSEVILKDIIRKFLTTEFEGGRHVTRINKIKAMES